MSLSIERFDYDLPPERIAQEPLARRDQSRLMVLRRPRGQVEHRVFRELPGLLRRGDLLVLNDTRVVPAKFTCRRSTGGRIQGLFLHEGPAGAWEVLLKGAGRCRPGEAVEVLRAPDARVTLAEDLGEGRWRISVVAGANQAPAPAGEVLARAGFTPLPPYIRRDARTADGVPTRDRADQQRYQTVYASRPGAVAAPTAGLHLTEALLAELDRAGVETARVTLHVGLGTFAPVKAQRIDRHRMHAERYELPPEAAAALNAARREGRRIVAVGTTSLRVLETVAAAGRGEDQTGPFRPADGWTDLFIYPPAEFRAVDALITNFHLPRSTLLMLVAAFCSPGKADGIGLILDAYRQAVDANYRFYSYGDAMLIE